MTRIAPGVRITRDRWGVPTVDADDEDSAWFGLGWAAATDRLGQLEYDRRRARGRWAAVVGPSAVAADRLARRLRLGDAAAAEVAAMDAATLATFEAYAAGVDARVAAHGTGPEHEAAGLDWEPWTPEDSVVAFLVRHVLMGVWQYKVLRGTLWARHGAAAADRLDPRPRPGMRVTVPPEGRIPDDDTRAGLLDAARADVEAAAQHLGFLAEAEGGSNAWVLAGSRTASGRPLLANDSHRALDAPPVYWQARVRCPGFAVAGGTFPGIPGFPHFGHTDRVGWAITNAAGDAQDLFLERFDGEAVHDPTGLVPADVRDERIAVRDAADVVERCWATPRGPVVHGDPGSGHALSLRWTATVAPTGQFAVLRRMLGAGGVRELLDAQYGWVDPLNNLVAADVEGHIGYLLRGRLPQRASAAATQVPVPGWEARRAWTGTVPFAAMPRLEDPPEGLIVTANNTVTAHETPLVSHALNDAYRVERIHELAAGVADADAGLMACWQADTVSVAARRWARVLAERGPYEGDAERARLLLVDGDGDLAADTTTGLVHACVRRELAVHLLDDEVGRPVREWLFSSPLPGAPVLLRRWFAELTWPDATGTAPAERTPDAVLRAVLAAGWATACSLGDGDAPPPWAAVHRAAASHPLHPLVGDRFDPPDAGIGGDNETIQNGAYGWSPGGLFTVTNLSVHRQLLDLADVRAGSWIVPGGVSGVPGDEHTSDQLADWAAGRLIPMHPGEDT